MTTRQTQTNRSWGCGTYALVLVIVFSIFGLVIGQVILDTSRATCQFVESGLGQLNPLAANPTTAEACVTVINTAAWLIRAYYVVVANIFGFVLLVISVVLYSLLKPNTTGSKA